MPFPWLVIPAVVTTLTGVVKGASAISDNAITDTERTDVNNKFAAYNTALANYRNAVQDALNNIASNQASSAASSATESLRTEMTTTMNNAINDAVDGLAALTDVDTAKNNAILQSKIETIKQTYKAITAEYQNNLQQAWQADDLHT